MIKRIVHLTLAGVYFCTSLLVSAPVQAASAGLPITAYSALLFDPSTSRILYSKNSNAKRAPASTVKLLTSLVVLDHLSLDQVITVPKFAERIEPSKINLKAGERFYVRDLVYAVLIKSANDAAEVLGVAVAGSTAQFGKMMNEKARSLGCTHSNFVRASGLPAENQYATAYDMALIMREAQRSSFIVKALRIKTMTIRSLGGRKVSIRNHNKMLWKDHREVLGKTGWTRRAKHCFVGVINSAGRRVLVSMLGSRSMWKDLKKLVDSQFGSGYSKVKTNDKLWSHTQTKKIQLYLKNAGFNPGGVDGRFGPKTIQAIERFQSAQGLPPDGIVGRETWTRLQQYH